MVCERFRLQGSEPKKILKIPLTSRAIYTEIVGKDFSSYNPMKLSTRSRYGTRMLVDIARHQSNGPVRTGEISKRQDISVKYLEQLILPLKKANLLSSVRGSKGGHLLAQKPEHITLGQIVRLLEPQVDPVECIGHPDKCPMSDECQTRWSWREATEVFFEKLDSITIAELADGSYKTRCEERSHG